MKEKKFIYEVETKVPYERTELKTICITAKNQEEASLICEKQLKESNISFIALNRKSSILPAIIFLFIVSLFSFFKFHKENSLKTISLMPGILPMVFSIIIYAAFVIRVKGINNTFKDFSDTLVSVLFFYTLAIFINLFTSLPASSSGLIGKFFYKTLNIKPINLIIVATILSLIGLKQICGFVWIFICIAGIIELGSLESFLGKWNSIIFLISSFLGVVFYLKYEGKAIQNSFKKLSQATFEMIKSDINNSSTFINQELTKRNTKTISDEENTNLEKSEVIKNEI